MIEPDRSVVPVLFDMETQFVVLRKQADYLISILEAVNARYRHIGTPAGILSGSVVSIELS